MVRQLSCLFFLVSILMLSGCSKSGDNEVLVKVGRKSISALDLESRIATLPKEARAQFESQEARVLLLEQMVREELLYQEALDRDLNSSDRYKTALESAKKELLIEALIRENVDEKLPDFTESDAMAYFNEHPEQFEAVVKRHVSHILVKDEQAAQAVLGELNAGSSFEELAKKHSLDTANRDNGGQVGWVTKDQVVPEFSKALFELEKEGAVSAVVKTDFGYHIIRYNAERIQPRLDFEQVKGQIIQLLGNTEKQKLFDDLVKSAQDKIKVVHKKEKGKSAKQAEKAPKAEEAQETEQQAAETREVLHD